MVALEVGLKYLGEGVGVPGRGLEYLEGCREKSEDSMSCLSLRQQQTHVIAHGVVVCADGIMEDMEAALAESRLRLGEHGVPQRESTECYRG